MLAFALFWGALDLLGFRVTAAEEADGGCCDGDHAARSGRGGNRAPPGRIRRARAGAVVAAQLRWLAAVGAARRASASPPPRLPWRLRFLLPFFLSPYNNTLGFDVFFLLHIYTYVTIAFILLSSVFRHCLCLEQLPTVSSNCVFCLCLSFCAGKVEFLIGSSSVELFGRSAEQPLLGSRYIYLKL